MADTSYVIKPQPPVRAFAIAAVLSLLGAALIVAALVLTWHWIVIVGGVVVLVVGLALLAAGLFSMRAREVTLTLSDDGYELASIAGVESGHWRDVTRVTQTLDRRQITIFEGDDVRRHLLFAQGASLPTDTLLADLTARLDAAKGYRNL